MPIKPYFVDTVTHIPAIWANAATDLIYDVFEMAATKAGARAALELGSLALQHADNIQLVGGSINNIPIGLDVPMQGRFTVLSVEVDPIAPQHAVNKRYLNQRLTAFGENYVPWTGGTMTGPLLAYGNPIGPLEVVPRRWVDLRILEVLQERPLQRWHTVSVGQTTFEWMAFVRPLYIYPENFIVYIDGQYQTYGVNYSVDITDEPVFDFGTPVAALREFDVVYIDNLRNLLAVGPPVVPPSPGFAAAPGWSDPINMRINYAPTNSGENVISLSHTVLRDMYLGCIVTTGALADRIVTWSTQWFPGHPSAVGYPPALIAVSATEAKLSLPEGSIDHYWEGRLELTMLIDGVPTGHRLWMDIANQILPERRDGRVRWGAITPVIPQPDVDITNVFSGSEGNSLIPDNGTTAVPMMRVVVATANVPSGAVVELSDGSTVLGLIPETNEFLIPAASLGAHHFTARILDGASNIVATSNTWDVTVVLPTATITSVIDNYDPETGATVCTHTVTEGRFTVKLEVPLTGPDVHWNSGTPTVVTVTVTNNSIDDLPIHGVGLYNATDQGVSQHYGPIAAGQVIVHTFDCYSTSGNSVRTWVNVDVPESHPQNDQFPFFYMEVGSCVIP